MKRFLRRLWPAGSESVDPDAGASPTEADAGRAAAEFWARWEQLLPDISAALGDGDPDRIENRLCTAVSEVHPNLHFSLERGHRAIYALVISAQGDTNLRAYTDAWKAAAPPDDTIWEYHDSVPPVPDPNGVTVSLGEHRIPLAQVRVAALIDEKAGLVDVAVFHPLMSELADAAKAAMTFLPLDATLGERLAGDRLGRVETAEQEPSGAIGLLELRTLVEDLDESLRPAPQQPSDSTAAGPVAEDAASTTEQTEADAIDQELDRLAAGIDPGAQDSPASGPAPGADEEQRRGGENEDEDRRHRGH
ncbi:hypothetical protein BKA25_000878 [Actinoalloteichus hymeniacidonis]|nr:hypothetical protein [Actinoalloteichus hymeniacidonis]